MRFPGIHLVEQTEQKFCRFETVLKKTSDCTSRALLLIKAPSKIVIKFTKDPIVYANRGISGVNLQKGD